MPRVNVIHANVFGLAVASVAALIFPAALLRGLGVFDPSFAMLGIIRMAGILILALGVVLWSARGWLLSPDGAPTLRVLCVICAMSAVMLLLQQIAIWRAPVEPVPIVFMGLVSVSYAQTAARLTRKAEQIA